MFCSTGMRPAVAMFVQDEWISVRLVTPRCMFSTQLFVSEIVQFHFDGKWRELCAWTCSPASLPLSHRLQAAVELQHVEACVQRNFCAERVRREATERSDNIRQLDVWACVGAPDVPLYDWSFLGPPGFSLLSRNKKHCCSVKMSEEFINWTGFNFYCLTFAHKHWCVSHLWLVPRTRL